MADTPRYVTSKTDGILTTPWTGRVGEGDLDVIHFSFAVIVSNKAVQPFMKELCSQKTHTFKGWSGQEPPQQFVHNQITILKSSIEPVVHTTGMGTGADLYRYGDDAVVQLNLVCEYVFNKAGFIIPGTNPPKSVKPTLGSEKSSDAAAKPAFTPRTPKSKSSGGSKKKSGAGDEGEM